MLVLLLLESCGALLSLTRRCGVMLIGFLVSVQVAMREPKKQSSQLGDEVLQYSSTQINLSLVDSSKEWMVWGWLKRVMSSTWWAIIWQRRQWQSWRDNEPKRLDTILNFAYAYHLWMQASWIGFCQRVMIVRTHGDVRIQKLALLATSSSWLGSMLMFLGWMTDWLLQLLIVLKNLVLWCWGFEEKGN